MTSWDPRGHRSAEQKRREQDPTTRKLNRSAQLAPSVPVPSTRCVTCDHVALIHRNNRKCLTSGCTCELYVRPT